MKKVLTLLLFIFALSLSAQSSSVIRKSAVTNYSSSSTIAWSYSEEKFIYIPNKDETPFQSLWDFILNPNGTGSLRSGDVIYSISEWKIDTTPDGVDLLTITAFNHNLNREISIIVGKPEGRLFMAFYDYEGKRAWYFYE